MSSTARRTRPTACSVPNASTDGRSGGLAFPPVIATRSPVNRSPGFSPRRSAIARSAEPEEGGWKEGAEKPIEGAGG